MSKLFTLREWLSLEDTAKYLSNVFNEPVTISDVLTLALDGRITLSLRFESSITVREAAITESPMSGAYGKPYIKAANGVVFKLTHETKQIDEILDLPMIGGERECVRLFEWHDDIEYKWALPFDEFFLRGESGNYYVMIERSSNEKNKEDYFHSSNYTFCYGMPAGYRFVVKTKSIRSLTDSLQENPKKELTSTGEKSYLNIIGAMLELMKVPRPGRVDDAAIIRELVANYDDKYGISESNLNRKFAEAKRSLGAS